MSLRTFAIRQLVDESIEAGTAEHPPLSQVGITGAGQFAHPAMGSFFKVSVFRSIPSFSQVFFTLKRTKIRAGSRSSDRFDVSRHHPLIVVAEEGVGSLGRTSGEGNPEKTNTDLSFPLK